MNALHTALAAFQPVPLSSLRRLALASAAVLLTMAGAARLSAAGSATPQLVEVTNPVEVLGSVEIVGEPFKQRFMVRMNGTIASDFQNGSVLIPLPAGKRIVIESIALYTKVPDGSEPMAFIDAQSKIVGLSNSSMLLPMAKQGLLSGQRLFTAVAPVTMRLSTTEHDLRANVYRGSASGAASFSVSVYGYIESL